MARFNEILAGRFNRGLQKLTAMKGGPPAAQLATEIAPNIQFNQMGVDFRYLEGWDTFYASTAGVVGAAGQSPTARIVNPIGSNVVAVIEKLVASSANIPTTLQVQLGVNQAAGSLADLGTIVINVAADGRSKPTTGTPLSSQSVCHVSTNINSATVGSLISTRQMPNAIDVDLITEEDHQILLTPASVLNFFLTAAASTLFFTLKWRERFLEDSERN